MQALIEATPQEVKDAIIKKWLRYQQQVHTCKVMIYRKTMMINGYPNPQCEFAYKAGKSNNNQSKMKFSKRIFNEINEGNFQTKVGDFVDYCQGGKWVDEIPPLLDPALNKEFKNFDKVVEAHRKWNATKHMPEVSEIN